MKGTDEFAFYSSFYNSLEINTTFYNVPRRNEVWEQWRDRAPRDTFMYVIKAWRYFTHMKKLQVDEGDILLRLHNNVDFIERWNIMISKCDILTHVGGVLLQVTLVNSYNYVNSFLLILPTQTSRPGAVRQA